jgi:biotin carboxyl carrier protein
MKLVFDQNSRSFPIDLMPVGKTYRATLGDRTVEVEIVRSEEGRLDLLIDGRRVTAYVSSDNAKRWLTIRGQTFVLSRSSGARRAGPGSHQAAGELIAPMPGQIRAVNVREGEAVTKGQTLLVVEAMKMEIRVHAPFDGVVSSISVEVGQTVEREQLLVKMEHG